MILEWSTTTDVVVAVARIVVVAVPDWIATAIVVVVAPSIDPVVSRVGLMIYPWFIVTLTEKIP